MYYKAIEIDPSYADTHNKRELAKIRLGQKDDG